jgi:outer membrane protein TolC
MMKELFFSLLIVVSIISSGSAQTQFNSVAECLEFSKQNNPSLKIESLNREISHERLRSAWSAMLPQIRAFANLDDNLNLPVSLVPAQLLGGPEGEYAQLKFGTQYNTSYGAEASLSLVNVSNWKNIKSAGIGEEAALYQAKDKELSISEQVITAYYFSLLSREAIILSQDLVNAGDSLVSAAEVRLANGMIEPLEFNRVRSLYLESVQQFQESRGAYEKNINSLKTLCGIAPADTLILRESIARFIEQNHTSSELNISANNLPRYRMFYTKTLQAQEDLKKQRAKILPEISIFARVSRQNFSDELNFNQPWFDVAVAGLRAEWNLFTGFNRHTFIRQAALQSQIAHYDLEQYNAQAERELEELKINHAVAAQGVKHYTEHYQLSLASYKIAGVKYNQGIYSIDQYVTIYQEMVRSQNQYLGKLANYLSSESIIQSRNTLK